MFVSRGDFEWPSSVAFIFPAPPYFSWNDTVSETVLGTTSLEPSYETLWLRVTVLERLNASRCSGEVERIVTTLFCLCLFVSISLLKPFGEKALDIYWETLLKNVFPFLVVCGTR